MRDILIMVVVMVSLYAFVKFMLKEPILPWKEKKHRDTTLSVGKKRRKKKHAVDIEEEPNLFQELFGNVKDVSNHMIRFKDNSFALIGEVEAVNYFLKSQDEQEGIDMTVESWTASFNYPIGVYLQNRYIDISDPIKNMRDSMKSSEDLNEAALSFGDSMITDLIRWQTDSPRYETKRYLIFTHKINPNDLTADNKDELDEKLVEKTFSELMRRLNTAKSQLRKAEIHISLLPTEGIYDLLYHTFNRRKAVKQRFKDIVENEKNSLYITADQTDERIEMVKELIEDNEELITETEKEAV